MGVTYSEMIDLKEPGRVFFARAAESFRRLGWRVGNYQPNMLSGSKGMTIWSWGEQFVLRQVSETQVEISCENSMALWDPFGFHARRSRKLFGKLWQMMDSVPPPSELPPMPPPPPGGGL